MAGYGSDSERVGGDDCGLGAQAPPEDVTFRNRLDGVPPADVDTAAAEYPFEFATEYLVDNSGPPNGGADYSTRANGGFASASEDSAFGAAVDDFGDDAAMVRPYAWTRGRTKANYDLKLETLISTTGLGEDETLLPQLEHRAVSTLCRYPLSVAEIAAKLSIPLGVARVILSDMAELGLISIHRTFADDDIAAHLVLMERVLSGLRRL